MARTIGSIQEISLSWLTETLSEVKEFRKNRILELEVKQIADGIGQLGEFALLEVTRETGSKTKLFAKVQTANKDFDKLAQDYNIYLREVRFYERLADKISVNTPKPYYVEHNEETGQVIILLEYLEGWYNPDQIVGANKSEIDLAIDGLIPIATQFWGTANQIDWIPDAQETYMMNVLDDIVEFRPAFLERFGYLMSDSRKLILSRIIDYYPNFPRLFTQGTTTLSHWDYRVANLFFTPQMDRLTVIDWQMIMVHKPGWDLAYLLCTNVPVELRRQIYEESCQRYLEGIRSSGIRFSDRELEQNMMLCLLAMTCFPVVGGANCDLDNTQSKQLFEVMTERLFSAIEDYNALRFIDRTP